MIVEFLKENFLFIICCTIGTIADIGLLNVLVRRVNMDEKIANIISYTVGIIVAFFLCRSFVFDVKDNLGGRLICTLLVHVIGLIAQQWLLIFLVKKGFKLNLAKGITIVENAILMYFLTKYVVFAEYLATCLEYLAKLMFE